MTVDEMRRARNRRVDAERRKKNLLAQLRGEPTGMVDARPIRQHARALESLGWSGVAILAASGCEGTKGGFRLLVNGHSMKAERKFLAVLQMPLTVAVPDSVPGTCLVPTLGATRRLRALMRLGWRHEDLTEFIGRASHHLASGRYPSMLADDWRLVDAVYDLLSLTTGGSTRSMIRARRQGYAPPLAWDDIDDPNEEPSGIRGESEDDELGAEEWIDRILAGERPPAHTPANRVRVEIVAAWPSTGLSLNELERRTGWQPHRYRKDAA